MGNKIKSRAIDLGNGQEGRRKSCRGRREGRVGGEGISRIHSVHVWNFQGINLDFLKGFWQYSKKLIVFWNTVAQVKYFLCHWGSQLHLEGRKTKNWQGTLRSTLWGVKGETTEQIYKLCFLPQSSLPSTQSAVNYVKQYNTETVCIVLLARGLMKLIKS